MNNNTFKVKYCINDNYVISAKHNLYILHLNSRSIRNQKLDYIELIINKLSNKPKVIVISETWITENEKPYYNLNGYTAHHCIRNVKSGGGVSVFVTNSTRSITTKEYFHANSTFIIVQLPEYRFSVCGV